MALSPRDEWMSIGGLSFHYRDWGGAGQPLVLLHGLASTCHIWDLVVPMLARHFAVVAIDLRGHGQSAKPDHGYDFDTVGSDVSGLIEAMNLDAPIIVGHSWGGDVALELAVARPDLPKGLCFIDGGTIEPSARYPTINEAKTQMAPPVFTGVTPDQFLERVRSGPLGSSMTPNVEDIVMVNFEVLHDGTMRARLSRDNHIRIIEALWEHHPPALYPRVKCPVLLMPARQQSDPATAERMESRLRSVAAAEQLLPNSKTVWLEESIHDVPLQRPELVADVIKGQIDERFFG